MIQNCTWQIQEWTKTSAKRPNVLQAGGGQGRPSFKTGENKCSLRKTDNGGRTPADLGCVAMAVKCLHIPQTPRVPHTKALLDAYSSVEIRPARSTTSSPSASFASGWGSAGSLDVPSLPGSLCLCPPECQCVGVWKGQDGDKKELCLQCSDFQSTFAVQTHDHVWHQKQRDWQEEHLLTKKPRQG